MIFSFDELGLKIIYLSLQAYKLYKKGRTLEIVDSKLAESQAADQIAMCIQIALLCTQGDPRLRPDMRRVVIMLSKKPGPGNLEEPTRPGMPGSRPRRAHRPAAFLSSTAGTPGGETRSSSSSHSYYSSYTHTAPASSSTCTISPRNDPHGKQPMEN